MRFFKENFDSIVKLYINQIGVAIFSMFLYTAAGAISDDSVTTLLVKLAISIFAILFYFVLVYNVAWEIGAKDKIRIDGGRMKRKTSKGILLGILANVPNFLIVGIALILISLYILTGAEALYTVFGILNLIFRVFVSMYLGVIQALTDSLSGTMDYLIETLLFLVFPIIGAAITHLSYLMGLNDKRIFPTSKHAQ